MSLPEQITYAEHAADILTKVESLLDQDRRFALITSLDIEGGAAREVGSLALVDQDGNMTGYLSNGCIDRDIRLHALDALASGEKRIIRYGEGSRYIDLKLPCGGGLTVLIDPAPDTQALRAAAADLHARREAVLHFVPPHFDEAGAQARRFVYAPKFRLMLAGKGAIFRATAQAAVASGFEVGLMSPEQEDLQALTALEPVSLAHMTSPSDMPKLGPIDAHTAFLTLFHDHDWEPLLLKSVLTTPARFIGCMGSRRTHQIRLEGMRGLGVSEADVTRLHGPIGLVPSLRNASLIAVSSLAEIIQHMPQQIQTTEFDADLMRSA